MIRFLIRELVTAPFGDLRRPPKGQLAGLDVLRTFAVLMVVWGHTRASYIGAGGSEGLVSEFRLSKAGWIGVDLFFVLSGYLIGKQLWREWGRSGTIDFWRFFLRRGLRIWPLYFFFLAFVTVGLGRGDLPFGRGWSDAVFLTNYVNQGVVMGSWSLCTEEQFYLLAPLALIVSASRVRSLASFRHLLWIGLLALPAVRAIMWWRLTGDFSIHDPELFKRNLYGPIHSHCDGLLMGLILSNIAAERGGVGVRSSLRFSLALVVLSSIALVALRAVQREVFNFTGLTLVLGALVTLALRDNGSVGILQARPFYWISRLSFGMYLNHAYLHDPLGRFAVARLPGVNSSPSLHFMAAECIVMAASACLAVVTFCLIEHPFLRLRDILLKRSAVKTRPVEEAPAPPCEKSPSVGEPEPFTLPSTF